MFRRVAGFFLLAFLGLSFSIAAGGQWEMAPAPADRSKFNYTREPGKLKLNKYGLIDPTPDVISLEYLPKDDYGFVDWARAIEDGVIAPRDSLKGSSGAVAEQEYEGDVIIKTKMDFMPDVLFPHRPHNVWLKCSTCHPKIFKMKAGANPITMAGIWKGEFCGRCHDRVAFPTRNCLKCHSVKKEAKK